jgi:hypothetical protein
VVDDRGGAGGQPAKGPDLEDLIAKAEAAELEAIEGVLSVAKGMAKRGRVLSAANESKLREARDLLAEVLSQVQADDADGDKAADAEDGSISAEEFKAMLKGRMDEAIHNLTGRLPD